MTLRKDESQWLISNEDSVIAATRALEVLAMLFAGPMFAQRDDIALRAMGNMMLRLGAYREEYLLSGAASEAERQVGQHIAAIMGFLSGKADDEGARDQFHATLYWLDTQLKRGVTGWVTDTALGRG